MPEKKNELIAFASKDDFDKVESQIDKISQSGERDALTVHLTKSMGRGVLQDTWVAIAAGTALRKSFESATRLRGFTPDTRLDPKSVAGTVHGLAAIFLSKRVTLDDGKTDVDFTDVRDWIERTKKGTIEGEVKGADRMIVEFDQSRAACLKPTESDYTIIDETLFLRFIDQYRKELSFWETRQALEKDPIARKAERSLSEFFFELYDNAFKYGQHGFGLLERSAPQIRFLRVRKIQNASSNNFSRVAASFPPAADFARQALQPGKPDTLIEVTISDFGEGILDKFLMSAPGQRYQHSPRYPVLEKLLYTNATSNVSDPSAGKGIQNALHAAKDLRAFVSLRTAEFALSRSFAGDRHHPEDIRLSAYERRGGFSRVRGTHWQFIWAPPS